MRAALGALAGFSLGLSRGPVPARPRYAALGLGRSGAAARPSPGSGSPRGRLRAPLAAPRCALARPAGYFGLRSGARPAGLGGLPGVALGPLRVGPAPVCAAPRFPLPPPCGSARWAARAPPARGRARRGRAFTPRPRAWGSCALHIWSARWGHTRCIFLKNGRTYRQKGGILWKTWNASRGISACFRRMKKSCCLDSSLRGARNLSWNPWRKPDGGRVSARTAMPKQTLGGGFWWGLGSLALWRSGTGSALRRTGFRCIASYVMPWSGNLDGWNRTNVLCKLTVDKAGRTGVLLWRSAG